MDTRRYLKRRRRCAAGGAVLAGVICAAAAGAQNRPNILWITCEDMSLSLGCFGDPRAVTPNLDRLAAEGVRFINAYASAPVCAPARCAIITGMYPPSLGTQHMRSTGALPEGLKLLPQRMQEAGYYCTNHTKEDYNFEKPAGTWNESGNKAHWRTRPKGAPFFAVFNITATHESQYRLPENQYRRRTAGLTDADRHDEALVRIPPYHPDTPEVRRDWARYADMVTVMDAQVGRILAELEADGLAGETIVFFYSDHGAGMPRSKRWLYDSGVRVPLIVRFPEKYSDLSPTHPGGIDDRPVSFVDLAPTVLSLVGAEPEPLHQGSPFLGARAGDSNGYVYLFRGRMDERRDMCRAVTDGRYKYIRNFMPHLPYAQHLEYQWQTPTQRVWEQLHKVGILIGPQRLFWSETKPAEELYDTWADPHEVHNLIGEPDYQPIAGELRSALRRWQKQIMDLGFIPESTYESRFGERSRYDAARAEGVPLDELLRIADLAAAPHAPIAMLRGGLAHKDEAVRYWAVVGLAQPSRPSTEVAPLLHQALADPSPAVRTVAAERLARDNDAAALAVLIELAGARDRYQRLDAAAALDRLDQAVGEGRTTLRRLLKDEYREVQRVAARALEELGD